MEEESQSWLYSTPLATLLFCGAAAVFLLGYLPEAKKARECEAKVEEARQRIAQLDKTERLALHRIAELEAGVADAVEEAVREVMRYGHANEFLPAELE
ncbi:MAG: hypothetical protein LIP23_09025 [Planctomycetes bacterium]|nr:hypothetical protein [Planctomycetota bacterium]